MFKKNKLLVWALITFIFLLTSISGVVFAERMDTGIVNINSNETIPRDKFVGAQSLTNAGTVKGDLIFGAQYVSSNGKVEGDFIGAASDINLSGDVAGNVRIAGGTLVASGHVGKNVNIFGGKINIAGANIDGSLLACGGEVNISGKINGYTGVYGGKITLNGEFFGDVDVRTDFSDEKLPDGRRVKDISRNTRRFSERSFLTVLPGTIIHGKLIYHGSTLNMEKGAQVANLQWIKPRITAQSKQKEISDYVWRFIKVLFTTAICFLIGFVIFKLFPVTFRRHGEIIAQKPLNVLGAGVLTIFSIIAAFIIFIILMLLSLSILSPAVGLIFGAVTLLAYIILCSLAVIPVAVWLGDLIYKDSLNQISRFSIGLAIITFGILILRLLSRIPNVGFIFSLLCFILAFGTCILGVGALVYMIRDLCTAARKGEKME